MESENVSNDMIKRCSSCFYYTNAKYKMELSKPTWCWRFDFETEFNGYCDDKYFVSKKDCEKISPPQIIGYIKRKEDFDKEDEKRDRRNARYTIIGSLLGVIIGFMLNYLFK